MPPFALLFPPLNEKSSEERKTERKMGDWLKRLFFAPEPAAPTPTPSAAPAAAPAPVAKTVRPPPPISVPGPSASSDPSRGTPTKQAQMIPPAASSRNVRAPDSSSVSPRPCILFLFIYLLL